MFNKYVPIQSKENEFMVKLKKGDYEGCEKLVETVGNPYQLKI